jgi:predicted dehydrogenase
MKKLRVGVVGCGNISSIYLKNCAKTFKNLDIVALADLAPERAKAKAAEFGVPRACGVDELLAAKDVEAVLNLTIPLAHAQVSEAALRSGKHVYGEKPLATSLADGERLAALASPHWRNRRASSSARPPTPSSARAYRAAASSSMTAG